MRQNCATFFACRNAGERKKNTKIETPTRKERKTLQVFASNLVQKIYEKAPAF